MGHSTQGQPINAAKVLHRLRVQTGQDFRLHKKTFVSRRIMMRPAIYRMDKIMNYVLYALMLFVVTGCSQSLLVNLESAPATESSHPCPVYLWQEVSTQPRPVVISFMRIDLHNTQYEPIVMVSDDPDGPGPAEAELAAPLDIFKKYHALAAVNANAFARAKNADDAPGWHKGLYVDIQGLVVSEGKLISKLDRQSRSRTAFWIDDHRTVSVGTPGGPGTPGGAENYDNIKQGVSDWISPILMDGEIVAKMDDARHPRTLAGIDAQGRFITLAVVDGRRKGYSDGMTLHEAAMLMKKQGCRSAVNLDGGGSSIMLYTQDDGQTIQTANKPSDNAHRPIPVMLGVRKTGR